MYRKKVIEKSLKDYLSELKAEGSYKKIVANIVENALLVGLSKKAINELVFNFLKECKLFVHNNHIDFEIATNIYILLMLLEDLS